MRLVFHVRRAVPGDLVLVEVGTSRRRRIDAAVIEVLRPSPMRIAPRCRHFVSDEHPGCGGCTSQHLSLRHQLATKERHLKRLFAGAKLDPGLVEVVTPTSDDGWYYRNKMEFSFTQEERLHLGMHPAGYRYESVDQRECFLMSPFVSEFVPRVRDWAEANELEAFDGRKGSGFLRSLIVREGKNTGERLVELVTAHDDGTERRAAMVGAIDSFAAVCEGATSVYWTEQRAVRGEPTRFIEHLLQGSPTLAERLHVAGRDLHFDIHPRAFFQTNTRGAEVLYELVVEAAGLSGAERVLDLFCGTGTIGLCLAGSAASVLGIELIDDAVANARGNAGRNGIDNAEFVAGDVGAVLEELRPEADVVIVDPPRRGLSKVAFEALSEIGADRVVYVSCNPEALVKDLRRLGEAGWAIGRVRPVDMFPQTAHIETVVTLSRG